MDLGGQTRTTGTAVPAATRVRTPGWRDLRLWVGVLIVAVSVVAGSRVLAAADDTVAIWAVRSDAGAGAELTGDALEVHRVRFADADAAGGYFTADDSLPAPLRLVRPVGAGELLPRAAVGDADAAVDTVELPVAVDPGQVPPAVRAGSVVDIYLLGETKAGKSSDKTAAPALAGVTVVAAPESASGFGAVAGQRQLVLAVPEDAAATFLGALAGIDQPVLTVVRRG